MKVLYSISVPSNVDEWGWEDVAQLSRPVLFFMQILIPRIYARSQHIVLWIFPLFRSSPQSSWYLLRESQCFLVSQREMCSAPVPYLPQNVLLGTSIDRAQRGWLTLPPTWNREQWFGRGCFPHSPLPPAVKGVGKS